MHIYFLTTNLGKLKEAKMALLPYGIDVISYPVETVEPQEGSIEEIAVHKLNQATRQLFKQDVWKNRIIVVDDAGIFFEAYNEFPGIFTKRLFHCIGHKGIMKLLSGEIRDAYFEGALAVYCHGQIKTFKAHTYGTISDVVSDAPENVGFPYNSIFIPDGDSRVFAQIEEEERLNYSYRKKVFDQLGEWLKKEMDLGR